MMELKHRIHPPAFKPMPTGILDESVPVEQSTVILQRWFVQKRIHDFDYYVRFFADKEEAGLLKEAIKQLKKGYVPEKFSIHYAISFVESLRARMRQSKKGD
jgi:hypothetical protein